MMTFSNNATRDACSPRHLVVLMLVISFGAVPSRAAEISYQRDIRPILSDHCFKCHGPDSAAREASLRLDQADSALEGGDSGDPSIVPGNVAESELVRRILSDDESELMPPPEMKHPLSRQQKQKLIEWIEAGGAYDEHWSFTPLKQPAAPVISGTANRRNAIDAFVAARLSSSELTANPAADRYQLIRRMSLELTGLPPTPEEADEFSRDARPDAVDRLADRLLASPAYGERMAWNWLDAARYADSNGYQGDGDRTMWPWRDWVVEAFNKDLTHDRFTVWQIAGDLLPEPTHEQRMATAFFRNHMINGEGGRIPEENRIDYVMDMTETLGTVWLGLTLNCSRCHDHKYDPLTRRDYYSLFAFFNQTPVDGSGGNPQTPPVLDCPSPEQTQQLNELAAQVEQTLVQLESWQKQQASAGTDEASKTAGPEGQEPKEKLVPMRQRSRGQWEQWLQETPDLPKEVVVEVQTLMGAMESQERIRQAIPKVMVMADRDEPRPTYLLTKGLYNQTEDETTAATPARFAGFPPETSPNRLALAQWLVAEDQPLMARVAVNRLWQQVFGLGLVKTVEDFGTQGEWPSHPEMLDWLAAEYRERGWSTKRLLRTIVLSATYQQSSEISPTAVEWDPENRLLSHGPRFRMPSWMIRDQALAVSGLINNQMGGPAVFPYQPPGVWQDATFGNRTYRPSSGTDLYRRSLYTFWRRIIAPTMFFDAASRQTCTVNISRTNTPLQALTTLNDVTYIEASRVLAESLISEAPEEALQVWLESAFRRVLIRVPNEAELDVLSRAHERFMTHFTAEPEEVKKLLAVGHAPLRLAEPDQQRKVAALTAVCNGLLNLDEALTKE